MNPDISEMLCKQDEIMKVLRKRNKPYAEKTVSASTKKLARQKAELEEHDGWIVARENKKSIRLRNDKSYDEILEDDVWCILAKMGFNELSRDRQFKIQASPNTEPRQIDVFAKDDETVLFVECTACKSRKKKNIKQLIDKIISIRGEICSKVKSHYGHDKKIKFKWGIASRNILWRPVDEEYCNDNDIFILKESHIEYFKKLTQHLKGAAKYQLLGHVFRNQKIHGLKLEVPATKGKMGGSTFYNFLIHPANLLKIAYISHKKGDRGDDFETYQRMLQPNRLKSIGKYIDNGGQFPTNIVVNIKTKKKLRFDKRESIGNVAHGSLSLPPLYGSAFIIDGQHRLYGYSYSDRALTGLDSKTTFPVLAYENLSPEIESQMFIDINCEQVKVTRNLLNEIYAGLKWDSDIYKEKVDSLCSKIALTLNSISDSPVGDRIITCDTKKDRYRCLTLNSFVDGLKENKFLGEEKSKGIIHGPLNASYSTSINVTFDKATDIVSFYLDLFKKNNHDHWELGDAPGGFLCTNNGIRALFRVLAEIFRHIEYKYNIKLNEEKTEQICKRIEKYALALVNHFSQCSPDEICLYRERQALKGVERNSLDMMRFINSEISEFIPLKLEKFLENIDEEGTKEARGIIDLIEKKLIELTISSSKKEFGEDWFVKTVPVKVRTDCAEKWEKDDRKKDQHQYLTIFQYKKIAEANWKRLEHIYNIENQTAKKNRLKWMDDFGEIRNITHHTGKWPANKEQVERIRQIYNLFFEKTRKVA